MAEAQPNCGNIKIVDSDAVVFKEMLRFIYSDFVAISGDSAWPLMYVAKKYLIPGLGTLCRTWLEKELSVTTVFTVLEQSMLFEENDLKEKCLEFIWTNPRLTFGADDFLLLPRSVLEEVICADSVASIKEKEVYQRCVVWAMHRLRVLGKGKENPSDEEIREQLGNILYKIRFPTMAQKDFAEITRHSKVLTAEERLQIYDYMASGEIPENFEFMTQRRHRVEVIRVNRHDKITQDSVFVCDGSRYRLSFLSTVNARLVGVGLYGGTEAGSTHDVSIAVSNEDKMLSSTTTTMSSDGGQAPIKITIPSVSIQAYTWYSVSYSLRGPTTWRGRSDKDIYDIGESGKITFQSSVKSGRQLPMLRFVWME